MNLSFLKGKALLLVSALTLFLAGCGTNELSTLRPAGEVAQEQFNLMVLSIIIMLLVIAVVTVLFTIAVLKSRRSQFQFFCLSYYLYQQFITYLSRQILKR